MTLEEAFDIVGDHLPEDWRIDIGLSLGEIAVELYGPDGKYVDIGDGDQDIESLEQMLIDRVNWARTSDGLLKVGQDHI